MVMCAEYIEIRKQYDDPQEFLNDLVEPEFLILHCQDKVGACIACLKTTLSMVPAYETLPCKVLTAIQQNQKLTRLQEACYAYNGYIQNIFVPVNRAVDTIKAACGILCDLVAATPDEINSIAYCFMVACLDSFAHEAYERTNQRNEERHRQAQLFRDRAGVEMCQIIRTFGVKI